MIIFLRLLIATILGGIIGLERELTNKYAGLRTNLLVCLGSCIFTILSIYAFPLAADNTHPQAFGDPARIAAQVLTGIGFIGGGTVLRHGSAVYGLTTAATLWIVAAIGMACGTGMIKLAVGGTFICVAVLVGIRYFERGILSRRKKMYRVLINVTCKNKISETIYNFIMENIDYIHNISKQALENNKTKISACVNINGQMGVRNLYREIEAFDGVEHIEIQENNE